VPQGVRANTGCGPLQSVFAGTASDLSCWSSLRPQPNGRTRCCRVR